MKRTLLLVLALGAAATGAPEGDRVVREFRLAKDATTLKGWILDYDDEGFRFEYLGGRGRRDVRWDDLLEEDARRLRIEFGLELTRDEKLGLIGGHEVHFRGGGSVRGLLVTVDEDGTHRVRTDGLVLPYPADRIERVDETKVEEEEVFTADEIYVRRLQRRPPERAEDHQRLGDYLYDIGNWEGAEREYRHAIEKDAMLEPLLRGRLEEIREYKVDQVAAEFFAKQKSLAVLHGRWQESIDAIEAYASEHEAAARRAARIVDGLRETWVRKKQALYHRVKNEELDRAVRRYLVRFKPDLAAARSWITSGLAEEIEQRVRRRLELTAEELEMFSRSEASGAPHLATYGGGTFVVSKRAKTGKSSARQIRGDPDRWWAAFDDVNTRSTWLKAYAAERLDLFEVVRVTTTDCERCGGTGHVRKSSVQSLADGRHEWHELCPRCFGAGQDRGILYR